MSDNLYDLSFYRALKQYDPYIARALLTVFGFFGVPDSMLDLGCGTGITLAMARRLLVFPVTGVESSDVVLDVGHAPMTIHDLREPLDLEMLYELVICWEVAEHLEPEYADQLCDTIVAHTGSYLVFTAALPEQSGYNHFNCQPLEYWREKFVDRGLVFAPNATEALSEAWRWGAGPCSAWLSPNVQVFEK